MNWELIVNSPVRKALKRIPRKDTGRTHIIFGVILEASAFWALGFAAASVYNFFTRVE